MKRIIPLILTIAIITGIFSPVMASFTDGGISATTVVAHAQTATTPPPNTEKTDPLWDNIHCGFFGQSSMGGCVAAFLYFIPYTVGGWLLKLSANILDTTAAYTLSSKVYTTSTFITTGWRITRDFANVFFILILLFIALSLVLGLEVGHANPKKMLVSVIVVAIFINFSLFVTQVVIDTSNTLALVFYNQITAIDKDTGKPIEVTSESNIGSKITKDATGIEQKPIATALAQAFQPQAVQTQEFYNNLKDNPDEPVAVGKTIMILIVLGVLFLAAAYSFFVAAVAFIGRMIQLWILIIFAPVAFITYIVPSLRHIELLGWEDWLSKLGSTAFAAPLYFFFILLISLLAKASIVSTAVMTSGDSWLILISVFISTMLLVILLNRGTKYIKNASGAFGVALVGMTAGLAANIGGKVVGAPLGGVMGGAALLGQKFLGAPAKRLAESGKLKDIATGRSGSLSDRAKGWLARRTIEGSKGVASSSFDARHTGLAQKFSSATGVNLSSYGPVSAKNTAGGIEGSIERETARQEKWKKLLGVDQQKKIDAAKEVKDRKSAIDTLQEQINVKTSDIKEGKDALAEALRELADAKKNPSKSGLTDANGNPINAGANIAAAQKKVDDLKMMGAKSLSEMKDDLKKLKLGDKMEKRKAGDTVAEVDAQGNITKRELTKEEIEDHNKKADVYNNARGHESLAELEQIEKNVENARFNLYRLNQAQNSGYQVHEVRRDSLGNVTGFHIDSSKLAHDYAKSMRDGIKSGLSKAFGDNKFTDVVSGAVGMPLGFLVNGVREGVGELTGTLIGTSAVLADAIHHTDPKSDHKHEHRDSKGDYSFKSGGGGGGGHDSHGGGGHSGGHDDHGGGHKGGDHGGGGGHGH